MIRISKKHPMNIIKKGFTLVELVVVIAVIAILTGISVPVYFAITENAKETALKSEAYQAYLEYITEEPREKLSVYLLDDNNAFQVDNGQVQRRKLDEFIITPEVKEVLYKNNDYLPEGVQVGDVKVTHVNEKANDYFYVGNYLRFKLYAPSNMPECNHIYIYSLLEEQTSSSKINVTKSCYRCNTSMQIEINKEDNLKLVKKDLNSYIYKVAHEKDRHYMYCKVSDKNNNIFDFKLNCEYKINVTPTTSQEGEISYKSSFLDEEIVDIRNVGKTNSYNWTRAFYNDFNQDAIPELLPTTYSNKIKYKYLYKVREEDIEGYPDYNDFNYPTDEEWELLDENYNKEMEEISALIELYGEDSEIVKEANEAAEKHYNDYYDELCLKYEAADIEFNKALQEFRNTHDTSLVGHILPSTTFEVEEDYTLAYWLHIPFNYDPNISYPVVVFVPGEGGNFSDYVDAEGNVKGTSVVPYGTGWCNAWYESWYNQVKNDGESRDKYDCFMISIYPRNKFFRGEFLEGKGTAIGINAMHNAVGIEDAYTYTSEQLEGSSATYKSCYDASMLSPAKDAQLVVKLIDEMANIYNIDLNRQYILGASLGGIFTMDTISHYPDRFAAAVPVVSASADISESNCKYLTNMNIWAISGSGDGNCSRFHSKLFVNSINNCRNKYNITNENVAQYSFFPGGHSCGYIGSSLLTANEGVSITYSAQVLDFLFNSSK